MHLLHFKKLVQIQWLSIKPFLAIKQFGYEGDTTNVWLILTLIANNLEVRKTLIETKLLARLYNSAQYVPLQKRP